MGMTYNMYGYMRNACTTLVENLKRLVGRHVCRSEVNISLGLKGARGSGYSPMLRCCNWDEPTWRHTRRETYLPAMCFHRFRTRGLPSQSIIYSDPL
jgi:hypothetical protein